MENFVVSARKYRPQTFESVVGQSAITQTLRNAIENNHLAQAFLFCGPRGVGKTSCARILAREINKHAAAQKGERIDEDFGLNVFELDAASNNSVEDIRNLTDQVRFAPQVGTYKVYIIDEVHMLSQSAFNAFLKTLEEPPPHAIFILATTEKHKILPTILSRCQIFDFQRITVRDIADHLSRIAEEEGVTANPEGLTIIAEKADGAMRDALSMFDQLVSFSGNNLTYESVLENLNVLDYDYYFKVVDHVLDHRIPESLMVFDEILKKGFDGHNFIIGLAQHLRNLMVCKNEQTIELIETSDAIRTRYLEQSKSCSVRFIFKALDALNTADVQYKSSKNQRLLVELTLMRLCAIPSEKKRTNQTDTGRNIGEIEDKPDKARTDKPNEITVQSADQERKSEDEDFEVNKVASQPVAASDTRAKPETREIGNETPIGLQSKEEPEIKSSAKETEPSDRPASTDNIPPQPLPDAQRRKKVLAKFQAQSVSISAGLEESGQSPYDKTIDKNSGDNEDSDKPNEPFDMASLSEVWHEFAEKVRAAGRESLYSTLTLRPPEIVENSSLKFVLNNSAQELELSREKGELLDFLRDKLKNYSVDIVFEVVVDETPTGLYTTKDKFEAMVKKNPSLGKLSNNLNLDIY